MGAEEITLEVDYSSATVLFRGVPHLSWLRRDLVGFQTWKWDGVYAIELTMKSGATIKAAYEDRAHWERIATLVRSAVVELGV